MAANQSPELDPTPARTLLATDQTETCTLQLVVATYGRSSRRTIDPSPDSPLSDASSVFLVCLSLCVQFPIRIFYQRSSYRLQSIVVFIFHVDVCEKARNTVYSFQFLQIL